VAVSTRSISLHLEDAGSSDEAGALAMFARGRLATLVIDLLAGTEQDLGLFRRQIELLEQFGVRRVSLLAFFAELAQQPLVADAQQGLGHQSAVPDHLEPLAEGLHDTVGLQDDVEDLAVGGGRAGDLGGLLVLAFADADDVRAHSDHGLELLRIGGRSRIGQGEDVLRNIGQCRRRLLLDRIDVVQEGVVVAQEGVQRGRDAALAGAGDEKHALLLLGKLGQLLELPRRQAEITQAQLRGFGNMLESNLFARGGAGRGNFPIGVLFVLPRAKFALLRFALLFGVEPRDLFDEPDEVLHLLSRYRRLFGRGAVDVVRHFIGVALGGERDRAGATILGVRKDVVGGAVAEERGGAGLRRGNFVVVGRDEHEPFHRLELLRGGEKALDVIDGEHAVEVQNAGVAMFHKGQRRGPDGDDIGQQPHDENRDQPPEQDADGSGAEQQADPQSDVGFDGFGVLGGPGDQQKPQEIEPEIDDQFDDRNVAAVLDGHQQEIWHVALRYY